MLILLQKQERAKESPKKDLKGAATHKNLSKKIFQVWPLENSHSHFLANLICNYDIN